MSTSKETVAFILDQLAPLPVRAKAMFGEYGLYCDEKIVALICDETLFVKPTAIAGAFANDAWLAAREVTLARERDGLLKRLSTLGPLVLEAPDVEPVRGQLRRLVRDLEHHRQRLNDLVYDMVSLELGGEQ